MAETQRTIAELISQLADNTTGNISPEDVRDIVESLRPSFGLCYVTTPVTNPIGAQNVPEKILGTTALLGLAHNFSMPVNNRLQYDGASTVIVKATAQISSQSSTDKAAFYIAKNGSVLTESKQKAAGDVGDHEAAAIETFVSMVNGDYIEAWIENEDSAGSLTVDLLTLSAQSIGPAAS